MGDHQDETNNMVQRWEIYGIEPKTQWQGTTNILVGNLKLRMKGEKFVYEADIYTPRLPVFESLKGQPVQDHGSVGPPQAREKVNIHSNLDLEAESKPRSLLMLLQVALEREQGDKGMKIIHFHWQKSNYTTWTEGPPNLQCGGTLLRRMGRMVTSHPRATQGNGRPRSQSMPRQ